MKKKKMKNKNIIKLLLFFSILNLNSQTSDFITQLERPFEIQFVGDNLYLIQDEGYKLSKINILNNPLEVIDIFSRQDLNLQLTNANKLLAHNGYLYIGQTNKISRIQLNVAAPVLEEVVRIVDSKFLSNFTDFLIKDDYMYLSFFSEGKISKIDISSISSNYNLEDVITNLNSPSKMVFNGNDLYFSQYSADKVSKIDITETSNSVEDIVTDIDECWNLILNDNILYIGSSTNLHAINISNVNSEKEIILTNINSVRGFAINNNNLYIGLPEDNKIITFNMETLDVDHYKDKKNDLKIYPNPSKNFLEISGLNKTTDFTIVNILGYEILSGTIANKNKINIQNLTNGIYFLKLNNEYLIKFIKK